MELLLINKRYGSFKIKDKEFEGAKNANKALLFDKVVLTDNGCILHERNEHPILVGVLKTTGAKYGFTSHNNPIYLCNPLDPMYPPFYVASKIVDRLKNKLILFQFQKWEKEFPQGTFIQLIGDCGNIIAEKNASLLYINPYKWKIDNYQIIKPYIMNRNFLEGFTFNIDPEGCKDVDDCITLLDNGIAISIADVSVWFQMNSWMSLAEKFGTSIYENGKCVKPMFPQILSEDYLSLVENKKRVAYSLIIEFNETIAWRFEETVVEVNKSYTYENFPNNTLLNSYVERLSNIKTEDPHKIVEILMLYYNTKAGEVLKEKNAGILRCQKGKNLELAKQFEPFGDEYMYLCYQSAKYCLPSENTEHKQLNIQNYAHASSPIRRYVDIINQSALKGINLQFESVERFNIQQKKAKQYERDLLIMDLFKNKKLLDGIIIDNSSIFIPYLKKIIKYENSLEPKETVKLDYYMNPQNIRWKDKIIFQICK